MEEKEKNNEEDNKEDAKDKINIEFLIGEIKKKDELIDNLQKENKLLIKKNEENITLLKKELNNLKEKTEKEINLLKDLCKKQGIFNEEMCDNNIDNDNDNLIIKHNDNEIRTNKLENNIIDNKESNEYIIDNKEDNKIIKEVKSLKDLDDKYNHFEKKFENKLDFIQLSLSKLMIKEGIEKDIPKEFENKLSKIFKEQNDRSQHIDKNDLEELKKLSIELLQKGGPTPLEKTRNFFEKKLNKRLNEINDKMIIANLAIKKNEIFEYLDNLELELNFNIPKFRKEFNLPKEDYTDEYLLLKCKENNWDKNKAFCAIINQKYN